MKFVIRPRYFTKMFYSISFASLILEIIQFPYCAALTIYVTHGIMSYDKPGNIIYLGRLRLLIAPFTVVKRTLGILIFRQFYLLTAKLDEIHW